MKSLLIVLLILFSARCFSQSNYSIHDLKAGKYREDSGYIYSLPFEKGKKVLMVQAYDSKMSQCDAFIQVACSARHN